jgi:uncharacterized RDD family membrane protein YckC
VLVKEIDNISPEPFQGCVGNFLDALRAANRISFSRATARFFGTFLCASCGIGYLMAAFSTRKHALHDMIAGTLVVASK